MHLLGRYSRAKICRAKNHKSFLTVLVSGIKLWRITIQIMRNKNKICRKVCYSNAYFDIHIWFLNQRWSSISITVSNKSVFITFLFISVSTESGNSSQNSHGRTVLILTIILQKNATKTCGMVTFCLIYLCDSNFY